MKKLIFTLIISFISITTYSQTLYNQKGVSISYQYKYIEDVYSKNCKVEVSKYEVNCKIKNINGSAVRFRGVMPHLKFPSIECDNNGELLKGSWSPWFFPVEGYVIAGENYWVDLLPNQERTGLLTIIYVEKGKSFPTPDWQFGGFDFITEVEVKKEAAPKTAITQPEWGSWMQAECYSGLQIRHKTVELNNLNYQVHMYFEVRSSYKQGINFNFSLLDKNGKVHFVEPRSIPAGGKIEFIHKMDSKKISTVRVDKAKFSNGKDVPCGDGSDSNTNANQSGNSKQNANNSNSVEQTNSEIENLNQYLTKIPDSDAEKQRIINDANAISSSTSLTDNQKAARIKTLTGQAKARAERLDSEETARKAEEERQRKILEERDGYMRDHLQKGDDAYNSGQYANAKIHYSNALGFASTDEQRQQIQAAISKAQYAIEAEARKQRVEQKQKVEQQNNTAAASGIAGRAALLAVMQDEESDEFFSAKFRFGLGLEWVPLLTNSTMKQRTQTNILVPIMFNAGFKLVVGNDRGVSAHFTPEGGYGLMAFIPGYDGSMYSFGGMVGIHAGRYAESMFKAVAEAGYIKRGGSYNYDGDLASGGTSANDEVYNGKFNYGITRLGGGVLFQIHDYDEIKFFIKPMYYFDKFSFARHSPFTKMLGIQLGSTKIGVIDLMFSKNYGIGGTIDYPQGFDPSTSLFGLYNESYFQIRYSRQVKIK